MQVLFSTFVANSSTDLLAFADRSRINLDLRAIKSAMSIFTSALRKCERILRDFRNADLTSRAPGDSTIISTTNYNLREFGIGEQIARALAWPRFLLESSVQRL